MTVRLLIYRILVLLIACASAHAQAGPPGFTDAADVVENLVVEMRYHGEDNFIGRPVDGYSRPRCILTEEAAAALAKVQRDLAARGLGLKVFDCYRPMRAVDHFVRWAQDIDDVKNKAEYYPEVDKRDLFELGYIAGRSSHSRGSTVDVTLVQLEDDSELDMGTPFDFFSKRSWPSDTSVTPEQRANRMLLMEAMTRRCFTPLKEEWWHFTLADEPYPDTYFNFPVQ